MRQFFILIGLFCIISCSSRESKFVELGNPSSKESWVYLSGLAKSFDSIEEQEYRKILHDIGRELNIRFIALKPRHRCPKFDNKICWPHQNPLQAIETYKSIMTDLGKIPITGWVGFSNGGYFLQEISKQKNLIIPVITIGAAGSLYADSQIYVMIGKDDEYAYGRSKELGYDFIEYEGGHTIDAAALKKLLKLILNHPGS